MAGPCGAVRDSRIGHVHCSSVHRLRGEKTMSLQQSLVFSRSAVLDVSDVIGVILNYAVISTLAGAVALAFAIGVAALLDDRPLSEFFDFSNLADKFRSRGRAALR
jgi:hypothetical protein